MATPLTAQVLFMDGASTTERPLVERKARLAQVLACAARGDPVQ